MYRKNTGSQYIYFNLVSSTDGTAVTGATVTAKRSIDGAAQGSCTGSISEDAGGQYHLAASAGDLNGNNIGFLFTATGAIGVSITVVTTAADPTDSVRFGLTALPNAAAGASGGLPEIGSGSGQISLSSGTVTVGTNNDKTGYSLLNADSGTAQTGAASTITLRAGASATDNIYNGETVFITSGTGAGQARVITGYVGSTKIATVDRAWATNPANDSVYQVTLTDAPKTDSSLQVTSTGTGTFTANVTAWNGHSVTDATSGVPDVNVKLFNGQTAQTDANNLPKVDLEDIAGAAVSTTTAQLGVNAVKYNNQTTQTDANNLPKVDLEDWKGTAASAPATGGIPDVNVKNIVNTTAAIDAQNRLKVDVDDWGGTAVGALPTNFSALAINSAGRVESQVPINKNVAYPNFMFVMRDSTTHQPKTGLTNANFTIKQEYIGTAVVANLSGTVTEVGQGIYRIDLSAGELNGNCIGLIFKADGADVTVMTLYTVA
jgi:hypothetical protein